MANNQVLSILVWALSALVFITLAFSIANYNNTNKLVSLLQNTEIQWETK